METIAEKDCSVLGGLFQLIISDLKVGSPVWEDFLGKAAKLHSHLKTTVFALTAFLDAFQRIADLATNARGATKDIGTALTRLCLRHRSVEAKLKTFSSTIMDHLVIPLQERLEEWKKIAYQMDKDHAKEYKRVRQEIKKKSSDTLRLQKKVRKAGKGDAKKTLDTAIQDVSDKYHLLEETEKQAVRRALVEERGRYCLFVNCLRPVVESELATLHEVSHLQEVLDALAKLTEDPHSLPSASEQVIADVKSTDSIWSFQTPPSSPTSLGSRKSSMCSISSLNSSSGDSSYSPSHHRSRSLTQQPFSGALRLASVSSQDSGFTSQDTLFMRLPTPPPLEVTNQVVEFSASGKSGDATGGSPSSPFPPPPSVTATWPNLQDTLQFERAAASIAKSQRPHTISSAYERHNRPSLTCHTFQPLQSEVQSRDVVSDSVGTLTSGSGGSPWDSPDEQNDDERFDDEATPTHKPNIPPLPLRSVELNPAQPKVPQKPPVLKQHCSSQLHAAVVASHNSGVDPVYVNLSDWKKMSSPEVLHSECQDKPDRQSFQKDLAAVLAQNVMQQKQLCLTQKHSVLPPPVQVKAVGDTTGVPTKACPRKDVERGAPPPPERRSSTLGLQGPCVSGAVLREHSSWDVFAEEGTVDSSNAHAQLIRALNARLGALQHQDGQQPPPEGSLPPPNEDNSLPRRRRQLPAPARKPARAHSLSGLPDRGAFLSALDSKFQAQMQRQFPTSSCKVPSALSSDPRHRSASNAIQGTADETSDTCGNHRCSLGPSITESCDTMAVAMRPIRQDPRRSSLNLDHVHDDFGAGAMSDAAARVHTWLAGRGPIDASECRVSLLGQIRRGVPLRKPSATSDRSAPFFRNSHRSS